MLAGPAKYKMINAYWYMAVSRKNIKLTVRQYEVIREEYSKIQSIISKENCSKTKQYKKIKVVG